MKLYELCIDTDVKQYEYEVKQYEYEISKVEFNKTLNCIKLRNKNNILTAFLNSISLIDCQQTLKYLFITSLKHFSEGDIKKLTRYIRSHKKG